MTKAIVLVEQSELAKLIDLREDLSGKLSSLRKRLKSMYPYDRAAKLKDQQDRRKGIAKRLTELRTELATMRGAEEERKDLEEQALFKSNKEKLHESPGWYASGASQIISKQHDIDVLTESLEQPDPEIGPDPRIEVTNCFAACESQLAVVKAQIKVLIP
jgi:hypothetical protein